MSGRVRSLVASTGFFNAAEVDVAGRSRHRAPHQGHPLGLSFRAGRARVGARGLCLLRTDRGDARLVRSVLDRRLARRAAARGSAPRSMPAPRRPCAKPGAKHIYADTSSSDRYAGTRGFYQRMGFRRGGAACRFLRARRRQDHLCEVAGGDQPQIPAERRSDSARPASMMARPERVGVTFVHRQGPTSDSSA